MPYQQAHIKIVSAQNIDREKWDNCVQASSCALIYATYDYLQHMADNWLGIIVNDYEAVMPVPYRKKFGIRYCYNVPFIQQLGLFGKCDSASFSSIMNALHKYILYGDIYFNFSNDLQAILSNIRFSVNLIILLDKPYQDLYKNYAGYLKRILKHSAKQQLVCCECDVKTAVCLYKKFYSSRLPSVKAKDYYQFEKLAQKLIMQQMCFVKKVTDTTGDIIAAAVFFKDERCIYYVMSATTSQGRKLCAMHLLIDNIIKEFAGTSYIFDFEGSDIPGIKTFYESFGAVNQPYTYYHYNNLPYLIKWLKR